MSAFDYLPIKDGFGDFSKLLKGTKAATFYELSVWEQAGTFPAMIKKLAPDYIKGSRVYVFTLFGDLEQYYMDKEIKELIEEGKKLPIFRNQAS